MTMTSDRINELAYLAASQYGENGMLLHEVIDRAIKTALDEAFSEPATSDMRCAGFDATREAIQIMGPRDVESHIYAAMCAEKAKEWQ